VTPSAPLRVLLIACGTLLVVRAMRLLVAARALPSPAAGADAVIDVSPGLGASDRPGGTRFVGKVVLFCSRAGLALGGQPSARDHAIVAMQLAAAPRCWVARAVGAAAAESERYLSDEGGGARRVPPLPVLLRGVQIAVGAATAICVAVGLSGVAGPRALVVGILGGAATSTAPRLALNRAARRARRGAVETVAATLDVLAAAVAVGLPVPAALELAASHAPPAAAGALRGAAARRATGEDPRLAFAAEARRFGMPALGEVGDAVDRQTRIGAPLAPELRTIAARVRADTRTGLMEVAARRGPLATLVVALVIAPVCLAALTACLIGGLLEGGTLALR